MAYYIATGPRGLDFGNCLIKTLPFCMVRVPVGPDAAYTRSVLIATFVSCLESRKTEFGYYVGWCSSTIIFEALGSRLGISVVPGLRSLLTLSRQRNQTESPCFLMLNSIGCFCCFCISSSDKSDEWRLRSSCCVIVALLTLLPGRPGWGRKAATEPVHSSTLVFKTSGVF